MAQEYKIEMSALKAVKYPIFGVIANYILQLLGIVIAGFNVQMPEAVETMSKNPQLYLGLAGVIFVYDFLKHKLEVPLP
jgi:hypothetical protein